jgi:hypothetical protein
MLMCKIKTVEDIPVAEGIDAQAASSTVFVDVDAERREEGQEEDEDEERIRPSLLRRLRSKFTIRGY